MPVVSEERLEMISEFAEGIAEEHFPNAKICPATLIERKGITLSFGDYGESFDGMIEHKSGAFHVFCNTRRSTIPTRTRFTLAHEMGHYFIDEHRRELEAGRPPHGSVSDGVAVNPVEREADYFASHFLMPRSRLLKKVKKLGTGLPAIMSLAHDFDVSRTSTANAWLDLDLVPATVVMWGPNGKPRKRFAKSTYSAGYRTMIEGRDQVPPDSATGRAFRGEELGEKQFYECGTLASQWFPGVAQGSNKDVVVIEQAIGLGEFGFLTIIFPKDGHF